ncbi:polysaccharide deacetylase family protein [Caproiciproducens sp. LBM24188]
MKWMIISEKRVVGVLCGICFLAVAAMAAPNVLSEAAFSESRAIPIRSVQTSEKRAALTFDADSDDLETRRLLEVLQRYQVKCTFFTVGAWAEKYPESIRAITAQGHEIGNHSATHPHLSALSRQQISAQMQSCSRSIQNARGARPTLFRPPYGESESVVAQVARSLQMTCVLWNVDSMDWINLPPREISERVVTQVEPGSIVLLHCGGARNTASALPRILKTLQSEGYELVPVSQLLYPEPYAVTEAGVQVPAIRR